MGHKLCVVALVTLTLTLLCSFAGMPILAPDCTCRIKIVYEPLNIGGTPYIKVTYTPDFPHSEDDEENNQNGKCKQGAACKTKVACGTAGSLQIRNVNPHGNPLRWKLNGAPPCHKVAPNENISNHPIEIPALDCGTSIKYQFQIGGCDAPWNPQYYWELSCTSCTGGGAPPAK